MKKEDTAPKFTEKKVDDLIASFARPPKDIGMVESMIEVEKRKQRLRSKTQQEREARRMSKQRIRRI